MADQQVQSSELGYERLGSAKLSVLDVVAQSLGFIGPVFSAAFLLPAIAGLGFTGKGAGVASPLALIIATIGISGVAWIISRYATRIHAAGALYDYVTDGFGARAGFMAGWIYYGGMTLLLLAIFPAFGGFLNLTLLNHEIDIAWWVLALAFIVVCFGMTFLGVQISTRAQLVLALLSVAAVFGWAVWIVFTGGATGNSIAPFDPSSTSGSNLVYGLVYAALVFTGFETAANLAEETADPKRAIPRAIVGSVIVVGFFYVVVMYAMESAFGFDMGAFLDLANFPPLYVGASSPGTGSLGFGEIIQWIVVLDIAAVALGVCNACSRGYFALARDGRLPSPLAKVHQRFQTPYVATFLLGIVSVAVVLWTEASDGIVSGADTDPGVWFRFFQFGATYGALGLIIVYLMISLSGFKPQPGAKRGGLVLAAIVGTATTGAAIFATVYKAPPIYALNSVWWVTLIFIGVGVVVMLILNSRGVFERETAGQTFEAQAARES